MAVSPTITEAGMSIPSVAEILQGLIEDYQSIYGSDVILSPDTQDGQFLGILAQSVYDAFAAALFAYNQMSPSTAVGVGLSSVVKINGMSRLVPSNSTCTVVLVGVAGTVIINGQIGDNQSLGTVWDLPASVTIPGSGNITVTATCTEPGAITAGGSTLQVILTPTAGWQTVTNPTAAAPGDPSETDAELRVRQALSTELPAVGILDGIVGGVATIVDVTQLRAYENATNSTDANGLPPHSFCLVVLGGDTQSIVNAIGLRKPPGIQTYGSTSGNYVDVYGVSHTINYTIPTQKTVLVNITIKALSGYTTAIGEEVRTAIANYISALGIGQSVYLTRLYIPAQLQGTIGSAAAASPSDANTFEVTALAISFAPAVPAAADLTVAYNEITICHVENITLTVT